MFDALKNIGNLGEMLKNARQMQDKMQQMQAELAQKHVTSDAGAGMVTATVNGKLELIKLRIDKTRFDPADIDMMEDLIVAAVHAAQSKAMGMMQEEMRKMAGDMGLPPGMLPGM